MAKVAGSVWIEGNEFHYVDQFNREWYLPGVFVKAVSGAKPGSMWVDQQGGGGQTLMFVNEAGTGVYYPAPYGDKAAPIAAIFGSAWIGEDNFFRYIGIPIDANNRYNIRLHNDVALVNTHADTHTDSPHVDTVHTDRAHTDVPATATHDDWHIDDPHHDFTDNWHTDVPYNPYQNFQDFSDQIYYYHPTISHFDQQVVYHHGDYRSGGGTFHEDYSRFYDHGQARPPEQSSHDDFYNHTDTPHGDQAHQDGHGDSAHQDEATENFHGDHNDSTAHNDVSHLDVAHGDGHTDSHSDSHGDTPHTDLPILIGP